MNKNGNANRALEGGNFEEEKAQYDENGDRPQSGKKSKKNKNGKNNKDCIIFWEI